MENKISKLSDLDKEMFATIGVCCSIVLVIGLVMLVVALAMFAAGWL